VALPILGLLVWLTVGSGLKPLRDIGAEVARRRASDLSPITVETAPTEVKPLLENLNQLFQRVGRAMDNERRFTGDASHELRTPLAALRTQAQVALNASADPERQHALEAVIAGCDRMTHLMEQLLALSRLDAADTATLMGDCNLAAVARRVVASQAPAAMAENREIAYQGPDNAPLRGNDTWLEMLLGNLVANALRHTPASTCVTVSVARESGATRLTVSDQGAGIPPDQRDKVLQRFTRLAGQNVRGAGLGLSIVARVAELHGATLSLGGAEGGGLKVTVDFPAA
jgi:two-component system sensor histidine kinase QseC